MILDKRCYVIKKIGIVAVADGEVERTPMNLKQVTWGKFGGAQVAWDIAKMEANFV